MSNRVTASRFISWSIRLNQRSSIGRVTKRLFSMGSIHLCPDWLNDWARRNRSFLVCDGNSTKLRVRSLARLRVRRETILQCVAPLLKILRNLEQVQGETAKSL